MGNATKNTWEKWEEGFCHRKSISYRGWRINPGSTDLYSISRCSLTCIYHPSLIDRWILRCPATDHSADKAFMDTIEIISDSEKYINLLSRARQEIDLRMKIPQRHWPTSKYINI